MSQPLRILLLDDHELFRASVARMLEQDGAFDVVGQCSTVDEAAALLRGQPVDVILLDYDLGTETGTRLLEGRPAARVLLVTGGMQPGAVLEAANEGASGLILKGSSPQQLIEAIRAVAGGVTWWDPRVTAAGPSASRSATGTKLTERQRRVLGFVMNGLLNKEIAHEMGQSESAVKAVLQELFHKTGVRTRSQLVRVALERYAGEWLP